MNQKGAEFDSHFHSVYHVEDISNNETIIEVKSIGYKLHDRVIKPALVVVGKNNANRWADQASASKIINNFGYEANVVLTPSKSHADYSTNLAMVVASKYKLDVIDFATKVVEQIDKDKLFLTKIEVVKPGFINFLFLIHLMRI